MNPLMPECEHRVPFDSECRECSKRSLRNKIDDNRRLVDLLRKQLTLIGSWTFSAMGQAECARFVADNRIPLETIFTHRWKLEQADEAYKVFDAQSAGKGVIEF